MVRDMLMHVCKALQQGEAAAWCRSPSRAPVHAWCVRGRALNVSFEVLI
jgi:hypothetical protein